MLRVRIYRRFRTTTEPMSRGCRTPWWCSETACVAAPPPANAHHARFQGRPAGPTDPHRFSSHSIHKQTTTATMRFHLLLAAAAAATASAFVVPTGPRQAARAAMTTMSA